MFNQYNEQIEEKTMEQLVTKKTSQILMVTTLLVLLIWFIPTNVSEVNAVTKPKAPRISSKGTITWDCVYFGHYPQASDGKGGFKNEPIKWRVLSVKGNDAFLLADNNLDVQPYNKKFKAITWKGSTIRSWLNGYDSKSNKDGINYTFSNFKDKAFAKGEQKAIYKKKIVNAKNPMFGTKNNQDTEDKVFLLSILEAKTPAYGFPNYYNKTKTREARNTAYTASSAQWVEDEGLTDWWWLRSMGFGSESAAGIMYNGMVETRGYDANSNVSVVRPALHLNLSSNSWKHAKAISLNTKPKETIIYYASSDQIKALKVQWKAEDNATGYQVSIATNKQFNKNRKTTTTIKNSIILKGLNSGKKYYTKVRGYVKFGKTIIYGPYSKVKSVKVK